MKKPDWFHKVSRYRIEPDNSIARIGHCDGQCLLTEAQQLRILSSDLRLKDDKEKLLKHVVKFRVHAYDEDDKEVGILDNSNARCTWRVDLTKRQKTRVRHGKGISADGYLQLPNSGPREINSYQESVETFGTEWFMNYRGQRDKVCLGCATTDISGHLLVIPSNRIAGTSVTGHSTKRDVEKIQRYDDTVDGPVSATVEIVTEEGLMVYEAESAWVVFALPDLAPVADNGNYRPVENMKRVGWG